MIAFIDDHRPVYGVEPICRVLPIAPSTDYEHAARRRNPARLPARACVFRVKSAGDSGTKSATDSDVISAIPI